jgi:hypothetical protein
MQKMPPERFNSPENFFLSIDGALEKPGSSALAAPTRVLQIDEDEIINEINAIQPDHVGSVQGHEGNPPAGR